MAGENKRSINHDEIRKWVEQRGGKPAVVQGTGGSGPGLLRINFPGYGNNKSLREISWDDFFKIFDDKKLEFLYQETTVDGKESRFFKFIRRSLS